ncbi:MAG TPA: hypothetical protein VK464_00895 [Symbiobacteriaceae bacterium]|jgi:hypothetical protein|nr:hypothetical protein [Symbiobacteriaceae bacterium]
MAATEWGTESLGEAVAQRLVALREYQELKPEEEALARWVCELQERLGAVSPESASYGELLESLSRAQARWLAVRHGLEQALEQIRTTDWIVARLRAPDDRRPIGT